MVQDWYAMEIKDPFNILIKLGSLIQMIEVLILSLCVLMDFFFNFEMQVSSASEIFSPLKLIRSSLSRRQTLTFKYVTNEISNQRKRWLRNKILLYIFTSGAIFDSTAKPTTL